jgi:hypothetical protein
VLYEYEAGRTTVSRYRRQVPVLRWADLAVMYEEAHTTKRARPAMVATCRATTRQQDSGGQVPQASPPNRAAFRRPPQLTRTLNPAPPVTPARQPSRQRHMRHRAAGSVRVSQGASA